MKKLSPNCAQLFLRNKIYSFTMVGTIALRQQKFFQRATLLQLVITNDCSQQHRMQNIGNKQKSRKLELACDIDLNKKKTE